MGALLCVVAAGAFAPGAAYAEPGDHIKVGQAEVVPSLKLGYEWRSNLYLEEHALFPAAGQQGTVRGAALVVRPGLTIALHTHEVAFDAGANYNLRKFITSSKSQNTAYNVSNLDQFNNVDLFAKLHILPNGVVGLKLDQSFAISNRPIESQFADNALITRTRNDTGAYFVVSPGNALNFDLGGFLVYDQYDGNDDSSTVVLGSRLNNKLGYGAVFRTNWEFFPRTALVVDARVERFDWDRNVVTTAGGDQASENLGNALPMPDGWGWHAEMGLKGRVTNKLVVNALVGYGQTTYDEQSVLDYVSGNNSSLWEGEIDTTGAWTQDLRGLTGLTAETSLTWTPVTGQSFSAGYKRSYQDSWFTNWVSYNSGFARYNGALARRWDLSVEGNYRLEAYEGEVTRNDHVITTRAGLSYDATDWLALQGGTAWRRRVSADTPPLASIEYDDVAINVGMKLTY
ncbi:MAG: hypothetical protein VX899_25940 [Myxococcota bacterium]|nr:hypothetical protein [Myxococcota bacterium]